MTTKPTTGKIESFEKNAQLYLTHDQPGVAELKSNLAMSLLLLEKPHLEAIKELTKISNIKHIEYIKEYTIELRKREGPT